MYDNMGYNKTGNIQEWWYTVVRVEWEHWWNINGTLIDILVDIICGVTKRGWLGNALIFLRHPWNQMVGFPLPCLITGGYRNIVYFWAEKMHWWWWMGNPIFLQELVGRNNKEHKEHQFPKSLMGSCKREQAEPIHLSPPCHCGRPMRS